MILMKAVRWRALEEKNTVAAVRYSPALDRLVPDHARALVGA
jgi:hypothetical protein